MRSVATTRSINKRPTNTQPPQSPIHVDPSLLPEHTGPISGENFRNTKIDSIFAGSCNKDMMKPCSSNFGRDCKLVTGEDGCPFCSCPYSTSINHSINPSINSESPARGCSGPQGMSKQERASMLLGKEHCPNGVHMQIVHRWYRRVSRAASSVIHCCRRIVRSALTSA